MNIHRLRTVLCCLLLVSLPAFADQTFRISGPLDGVSTGYHILQNHLNGDILALINQLDVNNNQFSRVYGVLIRNQPQAGNYAPGPPRLLSQDSGWQGRPNGIFLAPIKRFVVVWDSAGTEANGGAAAIHGRMVNTSGKPKGPVLDLIDNGDRNDFPLLVTNATPRFGNDNRGGVVTFIWNGNRPPGGEAKPTHGLNAAPAKITKKKVTVDMNKRVLLEENGPSGGGPYPERGKGYPPAPGAPAAPAANTFGVELNGFRYVLSGSYRTQGFSYILDVDATTGAIMETTHIDLPLDTYTPMEIGVGPANNFWGTLLAVAPTGFFGNVNRMLFVNGVNTLNEPLNIGNALNIAGAVVAPVNYFSSYAPARKPNLGYIVVASADGWVYAQRVTTNGALLKKPVKLFSHGNQLQSMQVFRIDREGSPYNTLIIWQKKVSADLHEAWAYFTNLK